MVLWCKAHIRNWVQDIQVGVPNELVIGGPIITKTVDLNSGSETNHNSINMFVGQCIILLARS